MGQINFCGKNFYSRRSFARCLAKLPRGEVIFARDLAVRESFLIDTESVSSVAEALLRLNATDLPSTKLREALIGGSVVLSDQGRLLREIERAEWVSVGRARRRQIINGRVLLDIICHW